MTVVLRNAILAFLEHPEGGTLADVQRFLLEPEYRSKVLEGVTDADVVYYWKKGFPQLGGPDCRPFSHPSQFATW